MDMFFWNINPGYFSDELIAAEHQELHRVAEHLHKRETARQDNSLRYWAGFGWALRMRHKLLACEMELRGSGHSTPIEDNENPERWPPIYRAIGQQFELLKSAQQTPGRIPPPHNPQQLWSQHKYSLLARNQQLYRQIGPQLAENRYSFNALAQLLTEQLQSRPLLGGIINAVQHMWGYVSDRPQKIPDIDNWPVQQILGELQTRVANNRADYLLHSTALSELLAWLEELDGSGPSPVD